AGKHTIQRPTFRLQDREGIELVVDQKEIEVVMVGSVDGQRPEDRRVLTIEPPRLPDAAKFRFLEPRRLSADQTAVVEIKDDRPRLVSSVRGTSSLMGGNRYELVIRPQLAGVDEIKVRDIPGVILVRASEKDPEGGAWRFRLDVTFADVLRRAEVLYYDVEAHGEHLTGEVPICLHPPRMKHWQVAAYLG